MLVQILSCSSFQDAVSFCHTLGQGKAGPSETAAEHSPFSTHKDEAPDLALQIVLGFIAVAGAGRSLSKHYLPLHPIYLPTKQSAGDS